MFFVWRKENQTGDPDSFQAVFVMHRKVRIRLFLTDTPPQPPARPHLRLLTHVSSLVLLPSLFGQIGHLQPQVTLHPGLVTGGMRSETKKKNEHRARKTWWPKPSEPLEWKMPPNAGGVSRKTRWFFTFRGRATIK